MDNLLLQRAKTQGIQLSHYSIDGEKIEAKEESVAYFSKMLISPPLQDTEKIFDDVWVIKENESFDFTSRLNSISDLPPSDIILFDENAQCILENISLTNKFFPALPFGYYHLCFTTDKTYKIRLLVMPKTAYQVQATKNIGLNIQLYSLKSKQNWGIGDFNDLVFLVKEAAKNGLDFVGINPLHEPYASMVEVSPYSASSRHWLNVIYLAVENLPEFQQSNICQNWFKSQEVQEKLQSLRQSELVDYQGVMKLKRQALEKSFEFLQNSKSQLMKERRQQLQKFIESRGRALLLQSLFNVLEEHSFNNNPHKAQGWLGWKEEWQQLSASQKDQLLKTYQKDVNFYCYLQWLCNDQLQGIQTLTEKEGMALGIYGDLAVSCARGGGDVWVDPDLFLTHASVGAPPDPLGPIGQDWSIPPYNPAILKARGFEPFIELVRANMRYFGVLRIDHIMGLFRLWLIPEGKTASDGLYVHYPFEELMAILAIESNRQCCVIVGEDLGTVPDEVRIKLKELAIFSYFVLYFEQRNGAFPKAQHFPQNAFATIGTHDVPSLKSFWHCKDLELFNQVGVLQGDLLWQKYHQRLKDKQALLDTLHRDNYLPDDYAGDALTMAMHDNLNLVIHQYLAESQSQLIGVQLENLISQEISFNLPGTCLEYPNWRKKLSLSIEDIFQNQQALTVLTRINQARK